MNKFRFRFRLSKVFVMKVKNILPVPLKLVDGVMVNFEMSVFGVDSAVPTLCRKKTLVHWNGQLNLIRDKLSLSVDRLNERTLVLVRVNEVTVC